jgi:hypothetical protein
MKYPIHRAKGPKHISVNQFDTGTILGSDWRSAEKEARFMGNWGRAGRWTDAEVATNKKRTDFQSGLPTSSREDKYADRDFESEDQLAEEREKREEGKLYMPDVNHMSQKEFESYLKTIRKDSSIYLAQKVAALRESRGKKGVDMDSEATLVGIAAKGHTTKSDPAHFQATLTHKETQAEGSTKLHSTSHKMFGLTYSPPSTSSSVVSGQVMNRMTESSRNTYGPGTGPRSRHAADDSNRDWVVSVAGLTGTLPNAMSTRDAHTIKAVDYTRSNKNQGQGSFELRKAHLLTPATVTNLQQSTKSARWAGKYTSVSGAKQPSPLDTFTFDIELQEDRAATMEVIPGSKEWVGRDNSKTSVMSDESSLGFGGPRSQRNQGEMLNHLAFLAERGQDRKSKMEAEREMGENNKSVASALVDRLRASSFGGQGRGQ